MLVRERYQRGQRRTNGRLPSAGYHELRWQLEAAVWRAEFADVLLLGCVVIEVVLFLMNSLAGRD